MRVRTTVIVGAMFAAISAFTVAAQRGASPAVEKDPFRGVTADGRIMTGLFAIAPTGVSTAPVMQAATAFIASLTPEQRQTTTFDVGDSEWRRWNNVHRAARAGLAFKDMTDEQRARGYGLLQAGLSARGLEKTRNVMKLNHTIAELTNNYTEYGEGLYNLVVLGVPSPTEPWGWQLEGHHLIVNYFVLGDQVVMTPTFMGSEPVTAASGKYAGISVLQEEQNKGLALMQALTAAQQDKARLEPGSKTTNKAQAQAYRDNLQIPYAGVKGSELDTQQRNALAEIIAEYVHNLSDGHAKVKMSQVRAHLNDTYFGWIGDTTADAVFYYRIHSPVILIEFDHQTPVALQGARQPGRAHIHSVVRTPNGNDYGRDLLRLHYERHRHDAEHGHGETRR